MVAPLPKNLKRLVVCQECGWSQAIKNPSDCLTDVPTQCPKCNSDFLDIVVKENQSISKLLNSFIR